MNTNTNPDRRRCQASPEVPCGTMQSNGAWRGERERQQSAPHQGGNEADLQAALQPGTPRNCLVLEGLEDEQGSQCSLAICKE